MERKNIVATYVIRGICIGFFFPAIAVLGCIYLFSPDDAQHTLGSLHHDFPLLWIIDSAPLVLGIISFIVGTNVGQDNKAYYKQINLINTQVTKHLDVINNFATLIQLGKDVDDVVWSVAKNAVAELGYVDCVIYLLDEEQQLLIQRAAHGNKNPEQHKILEPIIIKVGEGVVGIVAATAKGEIVNDTSKDSRYILDDEPRLSEIAVPMVHNGKVIGIIDSEHPEKNFFPADHLTLLYTIASITATKLVQTKYNDELKKYQSELEDLVEKRTGELSVKAQRIEEQNIELKKLSLFPEHNPNPVIELDFDYNVLYVNDGAKGHLKDTPLFNMDDSSRHKYEGLLQNTKKGKKTGVYEIKEGFWINDRHYDMHLYIDNEFKIMRIYLNDVTEIKKIQNELKEALMRVNFQQKELKDSIRYAEHLQS
ncbi:MAG TPA: GAF domain-containing protein [Flavobacteriales bacterium]|nr:GAF domain-containing protein [Flavobacteriales bacterium]